MLEDGEAFDVWPFWFSRRANDPAMSYSALFPIAGTIKYRLGYDRLSWLPFPLYVQTEKRGAVTTSTPWPFVRTTTGGLLRVGERGSPVTVRFLYAESFRLPLVGWLVGSDVTLTAEAAARQEFG